MSRSSPERGQRAHDSLDISHKNMSAPQEKLFEVSCDHESIAIESSELLWEENKLESRALQSCTFSQIGSDLDGIIVEP